MRLLLILRAGDTFLVDRMACDCLRHPVPCRRDAFTSDMQDYPAGAGSGIVWDKQGHVVTNYHVIKGASTVQIVVDGGAEFPAKVLGQDEDRDVAVLQVEEKAVRASHFAAAGVHEQPLSSFLISARALLPTVLDIQHVPGVPPVVITCLPHQESCPD
jgi:hypothetical protein